MEKREAYETCVDTTKIGLERLGRALLKTESHLTGMLIDRRFEFGRGISATIMVLVKPSKVEEFKEILQPTANYFRPAPKVKLN